MSDAQQELLDTCRPAIKRIARNWSRYTRMMDAEDLEQEAYLRILIVLQQIDLSTVENSRNFFVRVAYLAILKAAVERDPAIRVHPQISARTGERAPYVGSLDEIMPGTDGMTRQDILAAPAPVPSRLTAHQVAALHAAIDTLSPAKRTGVRIAYFGIAAPGERETYASNRNRGLRQLRANEQLRQAVQA